MYRRQFYWYFNIAKSTSFPSGFRCGFYQRLTANHVPPVDVFIFIFKMTSWCAISSEKITRRPLIICFFFLFPTVYWNCIQNTRTESVSRSKHQIVFPIDFSAQPPFAMVNRVWLKTIELKRYHSCIIMYVWWFFIAVCFEQFYFENTNCFSCSRARIVSFNSKYCKEN